MVAAGVLFLYEVEQKVKCFPQDIEANWIIRRRETSIGKYKNKKKWKNDPNHFL